MVATISSLPPEVWLEILGHLPRPTLGHQLAAPSPLLATSLVSAALGKLSQQLLFESVCVVGEAQLEVWAGTEARRWTVELGVTVGERTGDTGAPVEAALSKGLAGKGAGKGRQLRVVKIDSPFKRTLTRNIFELGGMHALSSFSTNCPFPSLTIAPVPTQLIHLNLENFERPTLPRSLPLLTHLSLVELPLDSPTAPDFASAFPRLTHLATRFFHTRGLSDPSRSTTKALPPTLTHFAIGSNTDAPLCACLPDALASLTLGLGGVHDFAAVRERWFPSGAERSPRALGRLTIRSPKVAGRAELYTDGVSQMEFERGRAEQAVRSLKERGCVVEWTTRTGNEWRGE